MMCALCGYCRLFCAFEMSTASTTSSSTTPSTASTAVPDPKFIMGIDFGTTYSSCSHVVFDPTRKIESIKPG